MNKTILVVDDETAVREIFCQVLRMAGYECEGAATGQRGLQLVREKKPAVVLLDVMLPDVSGLAVCREIKFDPDLSDVFVALCSGEAVSPDNKVAGLETGADDYIVKPLTTDELLARVRTLMRLRDTTAALRASEDHYRRLIEILPDTVFVVRADGKLLAANPHGVAMLGHACEQDLAGQSVFDFLADEDRDRFRQQIDSVLKHETIENAQCTMIRKDHQRVFVEWSGTASFDREQKDFVAVMALRNVTERLQADKALRASEERFRQLAENIRGVFWMTNPAKNEMLYVSPGYEEIWGKSPEILYSRPDDWMLSVHPDDRDRVTRAALTKQRSGEYDEIYRVVRPDRSIRWIHDRAFPVRDDSGEVYRVVGIAEDISRRRQMEEALRDSEARKSAIMRAALDAIITIDQDGNIRDVNNAAENIFGSARTQMLGKEMAAVMLPESSRPWFRNGLKDQFSGVEGAPLGHPIEIVALRADGTEFPVEFILTRIELSGAPMFTAFIRDISRRKRSEEQIRLLADAVQSTQELISITDSENRFTFVNQAFLETYGYTAAEVLGQTPEILYSPNNPAGLAGDVFRETLAGKWNGEILNLRKDGSEFPISLTTSKIKDSEGRILGLIGVARDITARKRAERQSAAFATLGYRLSAATTPEQAATIILDVALKLFGWDSASVTRYSAADRSVTPILVVETLKGKRTTHRSPAKARPLTPLTEIVIREGARLINWDKRPDHRPADSEGLHRGACAMCTTIRSDGAVLGIVFIQSETSGAYTNEDLHLLQSLADHCGDALRRIEMAEALLEAEAEYRSIFENAIEGIVQMTPNGRYQSANPALARILGYDSPTELMSSFSEVNRQTYVVPEKEEELRRLLDAQSSVENFEVERYRKDGSRVWTSFNGHAVRNNDGMVRYYEGTVQDITARKHAETILRESEERFRALFESAPIGIALHDTNGHYIHTNRAYSEMLGYGEDELKRLGVKGITYPEDVAEGRRLYGELRNGTRDFYRREKRYWSKTGKLVWAESSASAVRDHLGRLRYIISMVEDITADKKAEEELRQLPQRILDAQESERMRVARELHDGVNQLLASARMRLQKVEDDVRALGPAAREILARCTQLLVQALEENRRIAHNLRPSDLDELGLAAACRNLCREVQARTSLVIRAHIRGLGERLPPQVELHLFRIIQEALNNVQKHARADQVAVRVTCSKQSILLTIEDDGCGYTPQTQQGAQTAKRNSVRRGGMGLTNLRERAASLGGTCEIKSAPKKGTLVTVRVPRPTVK